MSWYKTGTITVTNGSPTITGAGTSWVDAGTLNAGDVMSAPDGNLYEIQSINSNPGITLASNYLGGSLSGQAYAIMPIGLLPSTLAQQVKSTLTTANTALASAVRFDTAAQGLTSGQQQNARTNIAALGAADVGAGRLSKSVAGGADVALTATEAANQFIELTGALTANINVTVPAAARLFMIYNATSGAYTLTVKTAAGSGIVAPQGLRVMLECDGTNVIVPVNGLVGDLYIAAGTETIYGSNSEALSVRNSSSGSSGRTSLGYSQSSGYGRLFAYNDASPGWKPLALNEGGVSAAPVAIGVATFNLSGDKAGLLQLLESSVSGVYLGNTNNAGAKVLDFYEEGTFSPIITDGANNVTTYYYQFGRYTRIGNRVFFDITLSINDKGSIAGDIYVDGLPYTSKNDAFYFSEVGVKSFNSGTRDDMAAHVNYNSTKIYVKKVTGGSEVALQGAEVSSGSQLFLAGSYPVV